jgi:hypothetical protein
VRLLVTLLEFNQSTKKEIMSCQKRSTAVPKFVGF